MKTKLWRIPHLVLFFGLLLVGFSLPVLAQNNPVPLINQPLVPDAVVPGGPAFTLTVNGTGFVVGSMVNWNGSPRTTTFVSGSQLTAAITAADIASGGTSSVTIVNPAPGGGTSNVVFLPITNPTTSVGFRLTSTVAMGIDPVSLAMGDFNADGNLDFAVANQASNTVSIFLGDGTGNFTPASSPMTGSSPDSVAVGDFNGDGKLDLAVANYSSGTLSIFLGDGTGSFTLASSPTIGGTPNGVAVGDFNRDGKLDLAVANVGNGSGNTVSILLGDGTGNFTLASSPTTGLEPVSVAVGDFNGDGKLDLAVANAGSGEGDTVSILIGDGTGNFTLASSPTTGTDPVSGAAGDFNGDGKLDLAVANETSGTVSILLGDGTGNFNLASSPAVGVGPRSVAVGDFNGDGKLDLAVASPSTETVSILLGDDAGNFTFATSPVSGIGTVAVAVGDFNGDGKTDLAVADENASTISILLQAPAVTLSPSSFNFGNIVVGTSSVSQTATLTNVGYATVNISGITVGGNDLQDFPERNNCPSNLLVGANCTITVKFIPVTGGTRTATVSISDNGGNNPQTISLTGTGLAVKLSKTKLNFGNVMVGKISQPQIAVLTNLGSTTLTISRISVIGTDNGDFSVSNTCHGRVAPGGTCNIIVRFIPTLTGLRTAAVSITDNGGGSPQKIALMGTGT